MYLFSAKTLAFYPAEQKQTYIDAGTLPNDVIEVEDTVRDTYNAQPPAEKVLGVDGNGNPAWVNLPLEQLIAKAQATKANRIDAANNYMNGKQWPGKAALGRLKGDELTQYGLWLDYLDALEAVDTSTAPDVAWPRVPA